MDLRVTEWQIHCLYMLLELSILAENSSDKMIIISHTMASLKSIKTECLKSWQDLMYNMPHIFYIMFRLGIYYISMGTNSKSEMKSIFRDKIYLASKWLDLPHLYCISHCLALFHLEYGYLILYSMNPLATTSRVSNLKWYFNYTLNYPQYFLVFAIIQNASEFCCSKELKARHRQEN